jgi:hypothetical protein
MCKPVNSGKIFIYASPLRLHPPARQKEARITQGEGLKKIKKNINNINNIYYYLYK